VITQECPYAVLEGHRPHRFPDDWEFGGANGQDPRADPRWQPTTYRHLAAHLDEVWLTQTPLCDDQAIDEFTKHSELGVVYLQVRRPGERDFVLLDWQYDRVADLVSPL
jgi:hypothetical protein